jgi:hypothetical protein
MIFASIFALIVGIGMIGMWSVSYFTNQIPELQSEPIRIKFHLAAEFATAGMLILAGLALLTGQGWAIPVFLVATGMLLYTVIVSPGYFAQKGQWAYLVMFGVILILAVASLFMVGITR